jgi:hypothetical protein
MEASSLIGLWEHQGVWDPERGEVIEWPEGTLQSEVREFLYFDEFGTFFYVKFVKSSDTYFDALQRMMTSSDGLKPIVVGTWRLEGNRLIEEISSPGSQTTSTNILELGELSAQRLIVIEPTTKPETKLHAAYARRDVEAFPSPLSEVETSPYEPGAIEPRLLRVQVGDGEMTERIQRQQQEIGALIWAGKLNSAHRKAQESVQLSQAFFGPNDPNTAACLSTLGACLHKLEEGKASLRVLERAKDIYFATLGERDERTAGALSNLAPVYRANRRFRSSLAAALAAVEIRWRVLGPEAAQTAVSIVNLGLALSAIGRLSDAAWCYLSAERILRNTVGTDHPNMRTATRNYDTLAAAAHGDARFAAPALPARGATFDVTEGMSTIVATCRHLLRAELSDKTFLLALGSASHAESYENVAFAIKTQFGELAAIDPDARPPVLECLKHAQDTVLHSVAAPLSTFSGVFKRVDRSRLGPLSAITLECAFPFFDGDAKKAEERLGALRDFGVDLSQSRSLVDMRREAIKNDVRFKETIVNRQFRRYAGDNNLPANCYASVCVDESGDDAQTLCRELFEYTDPRVPGWVFVSDTWDEQIVVALARIGIRQPGPVTHGIFVFLLAPESDHERAVYRHFYGPILEKCHGPFDGSGTNWHGLSTVFIPVAATPANVDLVIDMRRRPTQEWLSKFFKRGDGAIFSKRGEVRDFAGMLPALVYPEFGGSGVTKSIGTWMRTMGVNGLVFPSARSDVSVSFADEGELAAHRGWNFVDYRGAEFVPDPLLHLDYNPWYGFIECRQSAPTLVEDATSWQIKGVEHRYRMTRDFVLLALRHAHS